MLYLKCIGLVVGALLLGSVVVALLPILTLMGIGAVCLLVVYCLVQMAKVDITEDTKK